MSKKKQPPGAKLSYWEKRALEREKLVQGDTTKALKRLTAVYDKACDNINAEIKRVFNAYKRSGKLSDEEARQLLTHTETTELIQYLKYKLNTIADERIRRDILNRINAVSYAARITRLEALQERIYAAIKQTADAELSINQSILGNAYKESYYRTIFDYHQGVGIGSSFALVPDKALTAVLESKFKSKNYSERVWTNTNVLARRLQKVLADGIATGSSIEKMANEISDLSLSGKLVATRLIRTETTFFMGLGELEAYSECDIEKYKYLATHDNRTSPMCAKLDGKVFPISEAVPGENYPPLHPWCRSTTIAYFDDSIGERIARDKDGRTYKVPSDMTYQEWKEKYITDAASKADKELFEKYRPVLKELSPKTLEEFINVRYNVDEWNTLKKQYRILNQYKTDSGYVSAQKILEMDERIFNEKRNNFPSAYKKSGNIAGAYIDNNDMLFLAHSRIDDINSSGFKNYTGTSKIVVLQPVREFNYINVKKSNGSTRKETYFDTEAKLFEEFHLLLQKRNFKEITMLSERGMCDSCKGVMEQFKKAHPDVQVNVVSNKKVESNVWGKR